MRGREKKRSRSFLRPKRKEGRKKKLAPHLGRETPPRLPLLRKKGTEKSLSHREENAEEKGLRLKRAV